MQVSNFSKQSLICWIVSVIAIFSLAYLILSASISKAHAEQTGMITVCNVMVDGGGNIVDGSAKSGTTFKVTWPDVDPLNDSYPRTSDKIPDTVFTTPSILNTRLDNFPKGPGKNGNNSQCITYKNLFLSYKYSTGIQGVYYYSAEKINNTSWNTPLYNDGWTVDATIDTMFSYFPQIFDSNLANDEGINDNSNGHMVLKDTKLGEAPFERKLVILNQYDSVTKPGTGCISSACSIKTIGQFGGVSNNYNALDTLEINTLNWVRLEIHGRTNGSGSSLPITINEQINNTNFKLQPPQYSGTPTFKITRQKKGSETTDPDVSGTICPDKVNNSTNTGSADSIPDCLSSISANGYTIKLPTLDPTQVLYVYMQAVPILVTPGSTLANVDSTASTITYSDSPPITMPLDNKQVDITGNIAYFQISGGDIYSKGSSSYALKDDLPAGLPFALQNKTTIAQYTNPQSYGSGDAPTWNISNYRVNINSLYDQYFDVFKNTIQNQSLTAQPASGVYTSTLTNGKLKLGGSGWTNIGTGKNILIFVPGDLYLSSNIVIPKDSKTFLGFIVKGNIGIDSAVTNLDGLYIADGFIDTACDTSGNFNVGNDCPPNLGKPGTFSPLALNGFFYAFSGYNLDRTGLTGTLAGELFTFRPEFLLSGIDLLGEKKRSWKELKN